MLVGHIRSNLVAYVALFVAFGGSTAWAVNGPLAARNTVGSAAIIDGQVKRADLAPSAVTSLKVANGTLRAADFASGVLGSGSGRGPRGPAGPAGPRGPQGPPGPGGGGGSAASGPAGGDLTGQFPNPLVGPNAVGSGEVADNSLTAADLAAGSVGASEVADNALTGADVNESTLAQVPSALLGGLGRAGSKHPPGTATCDPESPAFGTCVDITVELPARTRVLVLGRITAVFGGHGDGFGNCRLSTSATGALAGSAVVLQYTGTFQHAPLIAISPPLGPGPVTFGIDCNEDPGYKIRYREATISAVALSPS